MRSWRCGDGEVTIECHVHILPKWVFATVRCRGKDDLGVEGIERPSNGKEEELHVTGLELSLLASGKSGDYPS